jgi:hypothetical protein
MIGVLANSEYHAVISEFFELFKTHWELYRSGRQYDVLLCTGEQSFQENAARLILIYSEQRLYSDLEGEIKSAGGKVLYKQVRFPLYSQSVVFPETTSTLLQAEGSGKAIAYLVSTNSAKVVRIGYNLFDEIKTLLSTGQPAENASIPTLDLHIAVLRDLIISSGISLIEIPPVPDGHSFTACLTHDVDHPTMRAHRFDHTMFGFLYRAVVGSLKDVFRGRMPLWNLLKNWAAVLELPFVHLGLAKDPWYAFDHYLHVEKGHHSTFFVIPFNGRPGQTEQGTAPIMRASSYMVSDIAKPLQNLMSSGCEIGLHGIDAWIDSSKGNEEFQEIRKCTGHQEIGVRMHWLYFNAQSPVTLERAGASYDSTVGYNETVGYRAGTAQAYKPLQVARLMELPMQVMDTALFYPSYLNLLPREAGKRVSVIIDHAAQHGGNVTVNWHDRSIFPERLWGDFYSSVIDAMQMKGAWFSTASQAVAWYRKRRSAIFEDIRWESNTVYAKVSVCREDDLPGLRLRIYKGQNQNNSHFACEYQDVVLKSSIDMCISL